MTWTTILSSDATGRCDLVKLPSPFSQTTGGRAPGAASAAGTRKDEAAIAAARSIALRRPICLIVRVARPCRNRGLGQGQREVDGRRQLAVRDDDRDRARGATPAGAASVDCELVRPLRRRARVPAETVRRRAVAADRLPVDVEDDPAQRIRRPDVDLASPRRPVSGATPSTRARSGGCSRAPGSASSSGSRGGRRPSPSGDGGRSRLCRVSQPRPRPNAKGPTRSRQSSLPSTLNSTR